MDFEKIKMLYVNLKNILIVYGDGSNMPQYKIVKLLIDILSSNENNEEKLEKIIHNYKMLFPAKGGLTEFYIWDDDFETRRKLNEQLNFIRDSLWSIMRNYI